MGQEPFSDSVSPADEQESVTHWVRTSPEQLEAAQLSQAMGSLFS
jgi:hypothetical protein